VEISQISLAFAERRKKEKLTRIVEKIFISNSINVGTRVRIEILKAIARKISNVDKRSGSGTCCQLHFEADFADQAEE
jgi:hypothetical protein